MFQHINEFLQLVNVDPNLPAVGEFLLLFKVAYFSKKVLWDRVKVAVGHPDFPAKLRSFILAYNSKHM